MHKVTREHFQEKDVNVQHNQQNRTFMNTRYDTFWERFSAGILDGVVFLPLTLGYSLLQHHTSTAVNILWLIFYVFARPVYTIWMHGKYGQTLGKMATGVILLNANETRTINYEEAFWREAPVLIMLVFFVILEVYYSLVPVGHSNTSLMFYDILKYTQMIWFLAEMLTMLLNDKRRALHDYIANTVAVQKKEFVQAEPLKEQWL
jgi:uncharacterized RDD family membrane protein YckC